MRKSTIIIFFIFLVCTAFGQEIFTKRISYNINYRYGFIIPHRSSMVYLIEDHVRSWDLSISVKTKGEKPWQVLYRTPDLGIGCYRANLGNSKYLGTATAAFLFIKIPIVKKKNFNLSYSMGEGLAFLSNPFNKEDNIYNVAIGSHANAFIDLGLFSEMQILKNLQIVTGFHFTHYSNGAWRKPNLGFNIPSLKAGLKFTLSNSTEIDKTKIKELKASFVRKNEYSITLSKGVRENPPPNGKKFYTTTVSINAERLFNLKRKFGSGLDVFYDPSLESRIVSDSIVFKPLYNFRSGLHLSYDLMFNRISFTMQAGAYFFTKAYDDGFVYSRLGLRVKVWKNITASLTLKTHFVKADVIEWGIGYSFYK
ncbi:MAG: acyloxyacyl hydrolase [Bacteroidia bacterium]|nr:acyloxyacyl hydrolase [Bacteroidia bacterium]